MPSEADLPPSLTGLAFRNAADVDEGSDFHAHVDRLIRGIESHFQKVEHEPISTPLNIPGDDSPPAALDELLSSFELDTWELSSLDDPVKARTVEHEPPLRPATVTDADSSTGVPDPDKDSSNQEQPQHRGIFASFLRKFVVRNEGDHDDAEKLFNTGVSRVRKGNLKSGFDIINKLLKTNPDFIEPWEFCGDWYHRRKEYDDALFHYEEAINIGSTNPHTYIRAAYSAARIEDVEKAYAFLKQSTTMLAHDDVPGVLWFNLGCYATRLQKNDEAICYLKNAFNSGYIDTTKYLTDPDLIPLRRRKDFLLLLEPAMVPSAFDRPYSPAGTATAPAAAGHTPSESPEIDTAETNESDRIIGIDLGTSNSVVAVMEGGEVKVIPNQQGSRITPSVVAFTSEGKTLVGEPAKGQSITNPRGTIYSIQRFMGRRHSEVQDERKMVPYELVGGASDDVKIWTDGNERTSPEVSALILCNLKQAAETYLGAKVRRAVISVPALFNDSQRQATKDAAQIAGLEAVRIITGPMAAALAYGHNKGKNETIAVFDLGGGTLDISILQVADGVFEVLSTNGDTRLGGDDWDEALINFIAEEFKKEQGIDLRKEQTALQRLKEAADKAKKDLSYQAQADIMLPFIAADASGAKHLAMTISRSQFETLTDNLFERCRRPVLAAIEHAKLKASDIDEVVLVGGSTRMPRVQQIVEEIFGKEPNKRVNPDEVVAVGAAIQGAVLTGDVQKVLLLDVTPLSLGLETKGGVMTVLVPKNTTIPTEKKETFTTAGDNQSSMTVLVYEGERPMAADNCLLGGFNFEGIRPAPSGVAQIEVAFNIDASGTLRVSAQEKGSFKPHEIRIQSSSRLTQGEIEQIRRVANWPVSPSQSKI
jgi:molecular chaperone DnaK